VEESVADSIRNSLTVLITTYNRQRALESLLVSMDQHWKHPANRIIVIDDGTIPISKASKSANKYVYLRTENFGISCARNVGLMNCSTPYFLLLEDDFLFTDETQIDRLFHQVAIRGDDVCGGLVKTNGEPRNCTFLFNIYGNVLYKNLVPIPIEDPDCPYPIAMPVSMTPNFFIGSKLSLMGETWNCMGGPWDEQFITEEHDDFFMNARENRLRVSWVPSCCVEHRPIKSSEYRRYRNNLAPIMRERFMQKWGLSKVEVDSLLFS